uniref:Glycosyltransferase n=1 Tax=Leersia perrieri TaxID=77586 RepID=A0A0D9W315_9ORYZ
MANSDHRRVMAGIDHRRGGGGRAHVVLFPFMAQGHVAPFRCLAALVRRCRPDARLTVVATPGVADAFRAHLAADGVVVGVHALPFRPDEHGLPADADTSAAIGFHQIITLFLASESLRPAFHRFLSGLTASNPSDDVHVMADMFLGWAVDAARDAGAASASVVLTCGGYGSALYFSLWDSVPLPLPSTASPDDDFPLPRFPDIRIQRSQLTNHLATANGEDAWSTFIQKQIAAFSRADAILVNTAEKLEPKGLSMLRQWLDVPTYPVGPLLNTPKTKTTARNPILTWLDKQPRGSVLYVSFGSQYTITEPQMMELARGLEMSGHRFVWVIRPPSGHDVNGAFSPGWLPDGFAERVDTEGRGLVARCWAPQVEILAHAATGAFLTHCGWNSVQEALGHGVPLIGWPLSAEQFYNAKMLADEAVCVEVARGGGDVDAGKVAAAVDMLLRETTSTVRDAMRRRAAEMEEAIDAARGDGEESAASVMRSLLDAVAPVRTGGQLVASPSSCSRDVTDGTASRVISPKHVTN